MTGLNRFFFFKIKPLTSSWICTRCSLNMPSTTHPAPLCPPYISSSLHSLSSAHSGIPKYQMIRGCSEGGQVKAPLVLAEQMARLWVHVYKYTGHTTSPSPQRCLASRGTRLGRQGHLTHISFSCTARITNLQSYKNDIFTLQTFINAPSLL